MHSKILFLVLIGLLCTNAKVLRKKFRQCVPPPCLTTLEPIYGCFGTCNCQNIFLNELSNCGCQYLETYGVLKPELPSYGRMPAIKLPKMPLSTCDGAMTTASFEFGLPVGGYEILPAINLPGMCDVLPIPYVSELPCPCQAPMALQYESPCGCGMERPLRELPSPIPKMPRELCKQPMCLPRAVQLPSCGCQSVTSGCQNLPCNCQNMCCGCQSMPCSCQSTPCGYQNMLYGCQTNNCKCQNGIQCGLQLPALELPCACQTCQLSPVKLPVYDCGCQSLPPPVIGCGGKYLRQVVIQPPFL